MESLGQSVVRVFKANFVGRDALIFELFAHFGVCGSFDMELLHDDRHVFFVFPVQLVDGRDELVPGGRRGRRGGRRVAARQV